MLTSANPVAMSARPPAELGPVGVAELVLGARWLPSALAHRPLALRHVERDDVRPRSPPPNSTEADGRRTPSPPRRSRRTCPSRLRRQRAAAAPASTAAARRRAPRRDQRAARAPSVSRLIARPARTAWKSSRRRVGRIARPQAHRQHHADAERADDADPQPRLAPHRRPPLAPAVDLAALANDGAARGCAIAGASQHRQRRVGATGRRRRAVARARRRASPSPSRAAALGRRSVAAYVSTPASSAIAATTTASRPSVRCSVAMSRAAGRSRQRRAAAYSKVAVGSHRPLVLARPSAAPPRTRVPPRAAPSPRSSRVSGSSSLARCQAAFASFAPLQLE